MRTLLLTLTLLVAAPAVSAQSGFMPYLGYNLEDEDLLIGVGTRLGFPLELPVALVLQPSIEYQFTDGDVTVLQLDVNAIAELRASETLAPYVGAGLGLLYVDTEVTDSNTELGLNLVGGVLFNPAGFGQPFAQARYSTRGDAQDALSIQGGVILSF